MAVDLVIGQGTTLPSFAATITDATGAVMNLTGKTVKLIMRAASASTPIVNAAMVVVTAASGTVRYDWTTSDTATPGLYNAEILVTTTATGATYTYPNVGYLQIEIEASLAGRAQQLVSVADVKDVLNIADLDRVHDTKIQRWIRGVQPAIERLCGPVIIQQFEEWHDGGNAYITLRRRPSTAIGTSPYLIINAISEYAGPIEWPLNLISSPDEGQTYSAQVDLQKGQIVRRTAGGGAQAFPSGPQAVHVWYTAGQSTVPDNIYEGTLELIRIRYQASAQALRRGSSARGQEVPVDTPIGFAIPGSVKDLLLPNRRFPSLA